jgi:hypothetical protein
MLSKSKSKNKSKIESQLELKKDPAPQEAAPSSEKNNPSGHRATSLHPIRTRARLLHSSS